MPEPRQPGGWGADPRDLWRTAFSVLFAASAYAFLSPQAQVPGDVPVSDKLVHAVLFVLLAVTGVRAGLSWRAVLVALLAWAVVSEVLQAVLPIGRDGNVADAVADAAGVLVGLAIVVGLRQLPQKR
ncbi:hypothetical protein GCM10011519_15260 [Marmoricola endophyticus]|uniref:VanZ family protein n=1 Tax=Marmoricola endophyticus TaxID=2040280 RepID=A0A917BGR8_9ACTN|nr:VanZ family protein [Marmoricola endophyticus]GGF42360.1 hypothetical protein GCM10011519_15260 [Marmoricola endophyticus]